MGALIGLPIEGALLGSKKFTWWRPIVFSGVSELVQWPTFIHSFIFILFFRR